MNCEQHSADHQSVNELLSPALFTKAGGDERFKKQIAPVNTGGFHFPEMAYSPAKSPKRRRCEQVIKKIENISGGRDPFHSRHGQRMSQRRR